MLHKFQRFDGTDGYKLMESYCCMISVSLACSA